ncbi:MAG TPA: hypothetical protein VLT13_00820 [Bacteroidota bacterium]|nr:hypothetical protein [Bacteroidota bacterium]
MTFRFDAELNDHLPAYQRQVSFDCDVPNGRTAEAAFTSLGVPASEIDLLLVNRESVGLG